MSKSTDTFSILAADVLPRSGTAWEGHCSANGRFYDLCLVGDRADNTYTLDLASGTTQMTVIRRRDGSYLTRHAERRGWQASSAEDVQIAEALLKSVIERERRSFETSDAKRGHHNVVVFAPRSKPQTSSGMVTWLRSTATRAMLASTLTFILLALL